MSVHKIIQQESLDMLTNLVATQEEAIQKLEAQNKELIEALKFYANEKNQEHENGTHYSSQYVDDWWLSDETRINRQGKRARETLKKLGVES